MHVPRLAGAWPLVALAALLLAFLLTTSTRAESGKPQTQAAQTDNSEDDAPAQLTEEQRLRALAILFSTMTWSGEFPPPNHPPPLVVKPPVRSARWKPPHHINAGGSPHTQSYSPEPASMTTALLGSGIACLVGLLRKRRSGRVTMVS